MVADMARANRLRVDGGVFHLTHRCHNRAFLLKFARDRDAYRAKVREHLRQFDVSVLDYCVTSNHVHLLVDASERLEAWAEVEARIRFCLAQRGHEGSRGLQPTGRERRNRASRSDA